MIPDPLQPRPVPARSPTAWPAGFAGAVPTVGRSRRLLPQPTRRGDRERSGVLDQIQAALDLVPSFDEERSRALTSALVDASTYQPELVMLGAW